MLYLVKIGRKSRRGNFETLCSIPVESNKTWLRVRDYYMEKYKFFDVSVSEFEQLPEKLENEPDFLSNVIVQYTEDEEKISEQYFEKKKEADALLAKLHKKITERYEALPFTNICFDDPLVLETKNEVTRIMKLPIYPAALIKHIGDGKGL